MDMFMIRKRKNQENETEQIAPEEMQPTPAATEGVNPVEGETKEGADATTDGGATPEASESELTVAARVTAWAEQAGADEQTRAEVMDVVARGLDYDRAVNDARIEGEVAGRNARIDELREMKHGSDGLPHLCNAGSPRQKLPTIFDLAQEAL